VAKTIDDFIQHYENCVRSVSVAVVDSCCERNMQSWLIVLNQCTCATGKTGNAKEEVCLGWSKRGAEVSIKVGLKQTGWDALDWV